MQCFLPAAPCRRSGKVCREASKNTRKSFVRSPVVSGVYIAVRPTAYDVDNRQKTVSAIVLFNCIYFVSHHKSSKCILVYSQMTERPLTESYCKHLDIRSTTSKHCLLRRTKASITKKGTYHKNCSSDML